MSLHVIDASVAIKWVVAEVHSELARSLLLRRIADRDFVLIAPDFLSIEIGNVLVRKQRGGELTPEEVRPHFSQAVGLFDELRDSQALVNGALAVALRYGRSIYDSLYVALALQEHCQLVTADARLYNALRVALPATMLWIEDVPG